MTERKILHIDMDAFYASIEQRECPELRGKPVIVGGTPDGRGVVASASYEARRYQIRSAMSSAKAKRLCPAAVFVRPNFNLYRTVSQQLNAIFREVTDLVEPLALDEAYLDVTENKLQEPSATKLAMYVKSRIRGQLQLTASAGAAPNKFLAKLASEMEKPNGLVVISPARVEEVVRKLPVEKLWGVGPATAEKLKQNGISTTEDLRRQDLYFLSKLLGKMAPFIMGLASGEDNRPVQAHRKAKSRGAETTFIQDTTDLRKLEAVLSDLGDKLTRSLIQSQKQARRITLKLRYSSFETVTRCKTLPSPTADPDVVFETACALLRENTEAGKTPVRLVGISLADFSAPFDDDQLFLPFG